jgi:hypothetical protein
MRADQSDDAAQVRGHAPRLWGPLPLPLWGVPASGRGPKGGTERAGNVEEEIQTPGMGSAKAIGHAVAARTVAAPPSAQAAQRAAQRDTPSLGASRLPRRPSRKFSMSIAFSGVPNGDVIPNWPGQGIFSAAPEMPSPSRPNFSQPRHKQRAITSGMGSTQCQPQGISAAPRPPAAAPEPAVPPAGGTTAADARSDPGLQCGLVYSAAWLTVRPRSGPR